MPFASRTVSVQDQALWLFVSQHGEQVRTSGSMENIFDNGDMALFNQSDELRQLQDQLVLQRLKRQQTRQRLQQCIAHELKSASNKAFEKHVSKFGVVLDWKEPTEDVQRLMPQKAVRCAWVDQLKIMLYKCEWSTGGDNNNSSNWHQTPPFLKEEDAIACMLALNQEMQQSPQVEMREQQEHRPKLTSSAATPQLQLQQVTAPDNSLALPLQAIQMPSVLNTPAGAWSPACAKSGRHFGAASTPGARPDVENERPLLSPVCGPSAMPPSADKPCVATSLVGAKRPHPEALVHPAPNPEAAMAATAAAAAAAGHTPAAPGQSTAADSISGRPNKRPCMAAPADVQQQRMAAPGGVSQQKPLPPRPAAKAQLQVPPSILEIEQTYVADQLKVGSEVYLTGATLGSGGFSNVVLGMGTDGQLWAIKVLKPEDLTPKPAKHTISQCKVRTTSPEDVFSREVRAPPLPACHAQQFAAPLATGRHSSTGQQCLVCELYVETLRALLIRQGPLPTPTVKAFMRQLLEGLSLMHSLGLVHRDIKPDNLLLGADGTLRLCDFGCTALGSSPTDRHHVCCGTRTYMAPEIRRIQQGAAKREAVKQEAVAAEAAGRPSRPLLSKLATRLQAAVAAVIPTSSPAPPINSYDCKVDVYSAAVTGLMMVAGGWHRIIPGPASKTLHERIEIFHEQLREYAATGNAAVFSRKRAVQALLRDPQAAQFFRAGLCDDPAKRPTAQQLLQYDWLKAAEPGPVVTLQ